MLNRKRYSEVMSKPYHHGSLRPELIRLGELEIASAGLQYFGLREVARKAGVSSAAAFRHFANKDDLVRAIAAEGFRALIESLSQGDALPPERKLRAGFEAYLQFAVDRPGCLRAMFGGILERSEPECEAVTLSTAAFAWLEGAVREGQNSRLLRDAGPGTALVFFSALHGAALLHLEMGTFPSVGPLTPGELADLLFDTLIKGLTP